MNKLLITGIPRSGTTLTTAIIDGLDDSLALSEPQSHVDLIEKCDSADKYAESIYHDLIDVRATLLKGQPILDRRNSSGQAITNYFTRTEGKTVNQFKIMPIIKPNLSKNFLLASKHNAHYTAALPSILALTDLPILFVIRHPIPTILSWRSLQLPISKGRLPAGEKYWKELSDWVKSSQDTLRIQIGIYDLFCKRYLEYQNKIQLVRYEQLTENESLIPNILKKNIETRVAIKSENKNHSYNFNEVEKIKNLLELYAPHAKELYTNFDKF